MNWRDAVFPSGPCFAAQQVHRARFQILLCAPPFALGDLLTQAKRTRRGKRHSNDTVKDGLVLVPTDTSSRRVLADQHLNKVFCWTLRELSYDLSKWKKPLRNLLVLKQPRGGEVVAPAIGNDAPVCLESVKVESLKRVAV